MYGKNNSNKRKRSTQHMKGVSHGGGDALPSLCVVVFAVHLISPLSVFSQRGTALLESRAIGHS